MQPTIIISDPEQAEDRLKSFGVTKDDIAVVVDAVVAAKGDIIAADAVIAAGTQAYLAGVRHTRLLFLSKGWEKHNESNIEAVKSSENGIRVIYQNVDQACRESVSPQAISGKGTAARRMIEPQGMLFSPKDLPEMVSPKLFQDETQYWFLCISAAWVPSEDGSGERISVAAELSLPAKVEDKNFGGFIERIFIINDENWRSPVLDTSDGPVGDGSEHDFTVPRKA